MINKTFNNIKFFLSKINLYFRYKKKKIILGLKWIFFGKEISNFSYEISNTDEILHLCNTITNIQFQKLDQVLKEINFENLEFKEFFSESFFQNYEAKNIFGRRLLWYILVRCLKPNLVIESGIDKGLGSTLLIYAQYKNMQEMNDGDFKYIGTDIIKKKNFIFNKNNSKFKKYQFIFQDTLNFLKNFNDKKKIIYISDAEHNYDFELKEFNLIKKNLADDSLIISDNNSGSLSTFSIENNKKLIYFHEKTKNFWYDGGTSSISYFY